MSILFVVAFVSSNFYSLAYCFVFVNNFFYFFILCLSVSQATLIVYHYAKHLSTTFFIFLQNYNLTSETII